MSTQADMDSIQTVIDLLGDSTRDDPAQTLCAVAAFNRLACLFVSQKRETLALELCQKARRIGEEILGTNHIEMVFCYSLLALIKAREGDTNSAANFHDLVYENLSQTVEADNCALVEILYRTAQYHEAVGHKENAEKDFRKALSAAKKSFGPEHPHVRRIHEMMLAFYEAKGDFKRARLCLRKMEHAGKLD